MSQNELRVTREELRATRDELRNKVTLQDGACRKASEAVSSIERLTEECHGLRGDLQRQEILVVQRDGAIASLRDEACTQWASGWLAFCKKSPFPPMFLESQTPRLMLAPLPSLQLPFLTSDLLHVAFLVCLFVFCFLFFFFFYVGL